LDALPDVDSAVAWANDFIARITPQADTHPLRPED
jgi:hypothetical protein